MYQTNPNSWLYEDQGANGVYFNLSGAFTLQIRIFKHQAIQFARIKEIYKGICIGLLFYFHWFCGIGFERD